MGVGDCEGVGAASSPWGSAWATGTAENIITRIVAMMTQARVSLGANPCWSLTVLLEQCGEATVRVEESRARNTLAEWTG